MKCSQAEYTIKIKLVPFKKNRNFYVDLHRDLTEKKNKNITVSDLNKYIDFSNTCFSLFSLITCTNMYKH